jgi:hypothetical protein
MAKVTKLQTTAVQGTNTNVAENLYELHTGKIFNLATLFSAGKFIVISLTVLISLHIAGNNR